MEFYQYEKLSLTTQEIRLLQLLPGDFDDEIRFTIYNVPMVKPKLNTRSKRISLEKLQETVPRGWTAMETLQGRYVFLRDDTNSEHTSWKHPSNSFDHSLYESFNPDLYPDYEPNYDALSYTWGSPDTPQVALVGSGSFESSTRIMKIGANLALALRYLRYTRKPRTLWVDAICINQADELERNHQVKFMASIYSMAHQVVIWLGPESTSSDLALATIQSLGTQIEYTRNSWLIRNPSLEDTETFYGWNKLPYNEETWSSLHELIQRPWFARLWIVQEARLSNARATVQCGNAKIPWTIFARAMVMLDFVGDSPFPEFRMQISTLCDTLFGSSRENISVSQLLWAAKNRQCTDPRDRVYGFLGLLPPKFADGIVPQYSLPVADVYKNACLVYIDRFERLDLLSHCVLEGRQIEAPSWVPDWSVSGKISRSPIAYACGMSRAHTRYLANNVLQVEGAFYGTICSLALPAPQEIDEALEAVQTWQPKDLQLYKSDESMMDAFLSTLLMGYVKEEFQHYEIPSLDEWRQIYTQTSSGTKENIDKNLARCMSALRGRSFIKLDNGHIGLSPPGTKLGKYSSAVHHPD
jgi:hypothetical protein